MRRRVVVAALVLVALMLTLMVAGCGGTLDRVKALSPCLLKSNRAIGVYDSAGTVTYSCVWLHGVPYASDGGTGLDYKVPEGGWMSCKPIYNSNDAAEIKAKCDTLRIPPPAGL